MQGEILHFAARGRKNRPRKAARHSVQNDDVCRYVFTRNDILTDIQLPALARVAAPRA